MRVRSAALIALALIATACGDSAFELETGQCLNEPDTDEVVDVQIVDCAQPHDLEVYRTADLPDQAFDRDAIDRASFEVCLEAFDGFVGAPYADSELDIYYLIPSEESWSEGDREVICAVYDLSGQQLTGTAQNVRR